MVEMNNAETSKKDLQLCPCSSLSIVYQYISGPVQSRGTQEKSSRNHGTNQKAIHFIHFQSISKNISYISVRLDYLLD